MNLHSNHRDFSLTIEGLKTWQSRELLNRLLKKLTENGANISKDELDEIADIKRAKARFKYTSTENWRIIDYLKENYENLLN